VVKKILRRAKDEGAKKKSPGRDKPGKGKDVNGGEGEVGRRPAVADTKLRMQMNQCGEDTEVGQLGRGSVNGWVRKIQHRKT